MLEQLETIPDAFNRRFRSMWERYCRGVNAIVYMVDSADSQKIEVFDILKHRNYLKSREKKQLDRLPSPSLTRQKKISPQASRTELKNLLERPQLAGIPVLVSQSEQ